MMWSVPNHMKINKMPSAPVKNKIVKSKPVVITETNLFFKKDKMNTTVKNIQKQKLGVNKDFEI